MPLDNISNVTAILERNLNQIGVQNNADAQLRLAGLGLVLASFCIVLDWFRELCGHN